MMSSIDCKDGSQTGFWASTKGLFKTIGCGINFMSGAVEAAAVSINQLAQEGHDKSVIYLVSTLEITNQDGSSIEDVHLAQLISEAYSNKDLNKISAIAQVYKLDTNQFFINQKREAEVLMRLKNF